VKKVIVIVVLFLVFGYMKTYGRLPSIIKESKNIQSLQNYMHNILKPRIEQMQNKIKKLEVKGIKTTKDKGVLDNIKKEWAVTQEDVKELMSIMKNLL